MTRLFADTFFFLALLNKKEATQTGALEHAQRRDVQIVTTWAVLIEVADALSAPAKRGVTGRFLQHILSSPGHVVLPVTAELLSEALALYQARSDKAWSLTDCASFIAMESENLKEALTADRHFSQAGFKILLRNAL